jgi:hypothetical protein
MQTQNLDESLGLDAATIGRFLVDVESNYVESNPYHNKWHAADVVQGMHFFLLESLKDHNISNEYRFASVIAAAVHDLVMSAQLAGIARTLLIRLVTLVIRATWV